MKREQYGNIIDQLEHAFRCRFPDAEPRQLDFDMRVQFTAKALAEHALAMLPKMREFLRAGRFSKLDRWVGCAQGFAIASGVLTLDQCREMNMPPGEVFLPKGRSAHRISA